MTAAFQNYWRGLKYSNCPRRLGTFGLTYEEYYLLIKDTQTRVAFLIKSDKKRYAQELVPGQKSTDIVPGKFFEEVFALAYQCVKKFGFAFLECGDFFFDGAACAQTKYVD